MCTTEMVSALDKIVRSDRRLKVRVMADQLGFSKTTVHPILTENINYRKVCARWAPKMLTKEHKNKRMGFSSKICAQNEETFLEHIVTGDETWVHYASLDSKRDSKTWKHPESSIKKKIMQTITAEIVMVSVFWDAQGNLFRAKQVTLFHNNPTLHSAR